MSKRFQKTRIVDKWGGIYDSKTDRVLDVNDVEHKLNEQQVTIDKLDQENADLLGARIKAQEEWEKCTDKLKVKILQLQEENERLKQKLENLDLNEKNDIVKMVDGKVFIRM